MIFSYVLARSLVPNLPSTESTFSRQPVTIQIIKAMDYFSTVHEDGQAKLKCNICEEEKRPANEGLYAGLYHCMLYCVYPVTLVVTCIQAEVSYV